MAQKIVSQLPQHLEIDELLEAHRLLADIYGPEVAQESDAYSLAQPSPYRYVPTVASNQTAPFPEGE